METLIEQLIADFHERSLPVFTRRRLRLPMLPNKVDTVIGMRRTGKTWFLYQVIADLLVRKHPKESILYLNLEDERLLPMQTLDLQQILDIYYRRYPGLSETTCSFFFDEIQNVPGWERFVRRLLDTGNIRLCVTGSSSRLLSREIATSLRGRSLSTEVFPFSFAECLDHQGITVEGSRRPGAKKRALLENRFRTYLNDGGFPEVQGIENEYRLRILQDYLDVVILRDLVDRHQIAGTVALRYLIRHLVNSAGSLFSVNKFYNDLKSQGIPVSKNTLHDYLQHLSDVYLFFQVPIHADSERTRMVNPRKIYAIDTGLVRACSRSPKPDWGRLLENLVFLELRRRQPTIEYYKTRARREVDFIVTDRDGRKTLVQAAADLTDGETRARELKALDEAMGECGITRATVVTMNQEELLNTDHGRVEIVPAWQWLLSPN
jgi:uncharacterized protein